MAILTYQEAKTVVPSIQNSVVVSGCFDILHIGHLKFLQEACEKGEHLVILLEGDEFISRSKGREPFHTQTERAEILSALKCVETVVLLPYFGSELEYEVMFKELTPTLLVVGKQDPYANKKRSQVEAVGGRVEEIDTFIDNKSTSKILEYFG